jgi:hypothetical protein
MNDPLYQRQLQMVAQAKNFFVDLWQEVNDFFISYQWQEILFGLKVASAIISLFLLLLIIFLLVKIIILSPLERSLFKSSKSETPVFSKKKILKRWEKINSKLNSGIEANYKLALIEAEKLFDRVIKEIGYGAEKKLANIITIKQANKFKDNIIEDKKFKLSKEDAERAVGAYKEGLKELGLL